MQVADRLDRLPLAGFHYKLLLLSGFIWLPTLIAGKGFTPMITLAQIPGYFTAAYLVEKIGRKATLVPFMLLCVLSSFLFEGAGSPNELVLWGYLVSFFNLGAWGVTYGYTPELYLTWLRGTGTGFAASFGRIGGFSSVFLMFAAILAAGALGVALLGEETRGRSLEEISGSL